MEKTHESQDTSSFAEMVDAICPKCGIRHRVKIYYTGKTKLKKFCLRCIMSYNLEDIYEYQISRVIAGRL